MRTAVIISLLTSAAPAIADERAERLAACAPLVTAIYEGCRVANHFTCPDGGVFTEMQDATGSVTVSLFDDTHNMVYEYNPETNAGAYDVLETYDFFDINLLFAEGYETENLRRRTINTFGLEDSYEVAVTYELTDQTRQFSVGEMRGIYVTQTQEVGFGGNESVVEGLVYIDRALGKYFIGEFTVSLNGGQMDLPKLIDIAGPASPFFMTQNPEDTCQDPLS